VITGFNTDVPYGGVTYHVQTEDKGLETPLILSLVYVGGAIIASKRTPYEDLISKGFDEQTLTERLQRQHKLIIAAIKSGRVEDLKRMGGPNGGAQAREAETAEAGGASPAARKPGGQKRKKSEPAPPAAEDFAGSQAVEGRPPATPPPAAAAPPVVAGSPPADVVTIPPPAAAEKPSEHAAAPSAAKPPAPAKPGGTEQPEIVILATLADEINALGDFTPRPAAIPPAPPEPPAAEPRAHVAVTPSVDAASGPVLTAELLGAPQDASDELYLTLLDDEGEFRAGQLATVKVYVGRGAYGQRPEAEASVTVKVLGTSFRPLIMSTATDAQGVGVVRALLPRFTSGRAAIIIRAVAGDDAAEMRRIIHQ
jgi:hypothetical protein